MSEKPIASSGDVSSQEDRFKQPLSGALEELFVYGPLRIFTFWSTGGIWTNSPFNRF